MTELEETMAKIVARQEQITDIAHLTVDCLVRIVMGKTDDPRADALATLRGCGMISVEDKCQF